MNDKPRKTRSARKGIDAALGNIERAEKEIRSLGDKLFRVDAPELTDLVRSTMAQLAELRAQLGKVRKPEAE